MSTPPVPNWLSQAELEQRVWTGTAVVLPPIQDGESPLVTAQRTIPGSWIMDLVAEPSREIRKPIVLSNVIIHGPLDLKYAAFLNKCTITNCVFDSDLDLSFAVFNKMACFEGTRFKGTVTLNGAEVKTDLELNNAIFEKDLKGQQLSVKSRLSADGASFQMVTLDNLNAAGVASFCTSDGKPARFENAASFVGAHFQGQAVFSGAQFTRQVTFDLAQIDGGAFFNVDTGENDKPIGDPVLFKEAVSFIGASVKMQLNMVGARFRKEVDFDGLSVTGDAHFENTQFGPPQQAPQPPEPVEIGFPGISVTGQAVFEEADFNGNVVFHQSAFQAEALFGGAQFRHQVKFDGSHFSGPVFFIHRSWEIPAQFLGRVSFLGAVADHDVYFREKVTGPIPAGERRQFAENHPVDLRGFTYARIYIAWQEPWLEPFDMQPYQQMERVFQTTGKDKDADGVYLAQRWRSFRHNRQRPGLWLKALSDMLYWALFNFGVKPLRLFVITAVLLIGFAWIFSQPGAVKPDKDSATPKRTAPLTFTEGLAFSFNNFSPIGVPIGSGWVPTDRPASTIAGLPVTFAFLATILRLTGWLFVPIGAAVFSGLVRQQKTT